MGRLEVEAKYRVDCSRLELVRSRLESMGATRVYGGLEEDTYFNHPCRDFAASDEALRLRVSGGSARLTYKGPRLPSRGVKRRLEVEVEVASGGEVREVLERLGFKPVAVVRKWREAYRLGETLIMIDSVEGLGCFIEIEGPEDSIESVASALGLREADKVEATYLELILAREAGEG